jgi:hypothetical protein
LFELAQQSVTKIVYIIFVNLVTPKARAKHKHFFKKLASEVCLLNI